jgi:purine operon repressor
MKKLKRSGRLVDMTYFLLQHPHELIPLTHFSERYQSAKSSISEDLVIIKEIFESEGIGMLLTVPGASGGVKFIPSMGEDEARQLVGAVCEKLSISDRILPGGYLYMMDMLGDARFMQEVGRLFSAILSHKKIDAVITVATKGIPLAYAVGQHLDVPVSIVRRDHRVTEGSMVSINYVSGSSKRIQTMTLARRSLSPGSNVFIVDDFMKAGGTVRGMMDLLHEFQAEVAGIGVLVESGQAEERLVDDYLSVARICQLNEREKTILVEPGNVLEYMMTLKEDQS